MSNKGKEQQPWLEFPSTAQVQSPWEAQAEQRPALTNPKAFGYATL